MPQENKFIHTVLVDPQIPQNTGSIARTCAALQCPLHIAGKPAFEISEKNVRRAGLDYWPFVNLSQWPDLNSFLLTEQPQQVWYLTKFAKIPYHHVNFKPGDAIVFGSETRGLGKEFLQTVPLSQQLLIPMRCEGVRSLNLSNSVSIVLYEAMKQIGAI
jgi:tRNA (cytidine/uridine-2'-O-)-methyltransferase